MGHYSSFVVRLWLDDRGQVRGRIEHVSSRDSLAFVELEGVVAFMRAHIASPPDRFPESSGSRPDG
jgi:hypothetical protein